MNRSPYIDNRHDCLFIQLFPFSQFIVVTINPLTDL